MNDVQREDCKMLGALEFIDWERFRDAAILITGATGLIGSNLVNALAYNGKEKSLNLHLVLPVRNPEAAEKIFSWTGAEVLKYDLGTELNYPGPVDYVVHLASPTSSRFFTEKPADTMLANLEGTGALLEWAKEHPVKKFLSLSTMEVYGFPPKGHKVRENELGAFETMNPRNSYPVAKIACEALCNSYHFQYSVPAVIIRATQTFGPGLKYHDGRVFAQFMRCVVEKKDIVLRSKGLTERSYLYTADAVSAILIGLLNARPGNAYTAANPETYCSIRDMAVMVAEKIAHGEINVEFDIAEDLQSLGYAETLYMDLDITKIKSLGWRPTVDLQTMYERMIRGIREDG